MTVDRPIPPLTAQERETLEAWLEEVHRATLAGKCEGLTDSQLRERAVPPSTLSLPGPAAHRRRGRPLSSGLHHGARQTQGTVAAGAASKQP